MEYIKKNKAKKCFLCKIAADNADKKNLVVLRTKNVFSVLNRYPYNNGHVMVSPNRHIKSITRINAAEEREFFFHTKKIVAVLKKEFNAAGFNIGANLGGIAGAGLEGHMHIHIVPRWQGDTNFMPVLNNTKTMPQTLKQTHKQLTRALKKGKNG